MDGGRTPSPATASLGFRGNDARRRKRVHHSPRQLVQEVLPLLYDAAQPP
jgi:hypothetical protein